MRLACSLLVAVLGTACGSSTDPRMVLPGGDDTTTGPGVDAAPTGDGSLGDGNAIAGKVCVIADLRVIDSGCAPSGVADLTVVLDGNTAMTADDGSFVMPMPTGSNLLWQISGAGIVTSLVPFSSATQLPAVTQELYDNVTLSNGVIVNSGEGSVVVRVLDSVTHQPASDVTATVMPAATYDPYYDGSSSTVWNQNATGTQGITWTPGVTVGTATVTLKDGAGMEKAIALPVADLAITFATASIP